MNLPLDADLAAELIVLGEAGRLRRIPRPDAATDFADFCSNDILGLAGHASIVEAMAAAVTEHGAGGRASRMLGGGGLLHDPLEEAVADWLGAEAALLYPSGYQANLGVVRSLARRGDAIISDADNHASLIDACRLSRAQISIVAHADLDAVERALIATRAARRRIVLTESVFSMDGDLAPLAELNDLCERHDAWLVIDEAHAAGLLGPEGAGAWSALDCATSSSHRLAARIVTGGKALGVAGALVVGSRALRDTMINRARSFMFTTAPPPVIAAGLHVAIDLARDADAERETVLALAAGLAERLGLPAPGGAIVPVVVGADRKAMELAAACQVERLDVRAVRPPTVPEDTSRLRVVCHSFNDTHEVDRLVSVLQRSRSDAPAAIPSPAPMRPLFIVGTDTGIGKTVVSALLMRSARREHPPELPVRYWKPVQTGDDDDTTTVRALADCAPDVLLPPLHTLALAASPHEAARHAGLEIDPAALQRALADHRNAAPHAPLLIELAGGLLVPYTPSFTQADWLARESPDLVLVARSGLGTLNHTFLTLESLRARRLTPRALFLVGDEHASNRDTLAALTGIRVFEVPIFASLDAAALDRWLDGHDLQALWRTVSP